MEDDSPQLHSIDLHQHRSYHSHLSGRSLLSLCHRPCPHERQNAQLRGRTHTLLTAQCAPISNTNRSIVVAEEDVHVPSCLSRSGMSRRTTTILVPRKRLEKPTCRCCCMLAYTSCTYHVSCKAYPHEVSRETDLRWCRQRPMRQSQLCVRWVSYL
jgi:hypothetical protein